MRVRIINTIIVKANEHNKNIEELWFSGTVPKILPPNKKPKTKQTKINIDKEVFPFRFFDNFYCIV